MKRFLKWGGIVLATPVVAFLVLVILLYIPPVQDFAVRRVSAYASEQTGMNVSLKRLGLTFPLDLDLQELCVTDSQADTILAASGVLVDLDLTSLLKGRIGIDALELFGVQLDTKDLIATTLIRGRLEAFFLHDDVKLRSRHVLLREVNAKGLDLDIALRDTTVAEDTSTSVVPWIIDIDQAAICDARIRFATTGDSLVVKTDVARLAASGGHIDLEQQLYTVAQASLQTDTLNLSMPGVPDFGALTLTANDIAFDGGNSHLALPSIDLRTPSSRIAAAADMDFAALQAGQGGGLRISIETDVSKQDLLAAADTLLPAAFAQAYPDVLLHLLLTAEGNMDKLELSRLEATLPGSFYFDAGGDLAQLLDTAGRKANIDFNLQTKDLRWVRSLAGGAMDGVVLPPMAVGGTVTADGPVYGVNATLHEGGGLVGVQGSVDTRNQLAYDALLSVRRLNIRHFLPRDSIGLVTLKAKVKGQGTDFLARSTRIDADAKVSQLQYGHFDLDGLTAKAHIVKGKGHLNLTAENKLLTMAADIDALLSKRTELTFGLDLSQADLQAMGLAQRMMKTSMCLHLDGTTDLKNRHEIKGNISDIILLTADSTFRLADVELEAILRPDTTHTFLTSGDLVANINGRAGYDRLLDQLNHFTTELKQQMTERRLDTDALTHRLPQIDVHLRSGKHNPLYGSLHLLGYDYDDVKIDLNLDPMVGINGGGHLHRVNTGTILLDTIAMHVYQDSTGVKMDARIRNGRRNPQFTFDARLNAYLLPSGAGAQLVYYDDRGRKGVNLGVAATLEEEGFRFHFTPLNPIIAYRTFHLNEGNFLLLGRNKRVETDIDLLADDGTGLKLYSSDNDDALQDLSVSVNRLNLGELMTVLPYAPRITGFLHGDAHLIQTAEHMSISTDMTVDNMTLENAPLGQVGLQAVYLPNTDGSHFIDGNLMQTGVPVASFTGTYMQRGDEGDLDVDAALERFPFSLLGGFLPEGLATLEGVAIGEVHVGGTTSKPVVDGMLATSGLKVHSVPYSLNLRVADDTIKVRSSDLQLNRLEVYSAGKTPFVLDGSINFADLKRVLINTSMTAKNFELINAKRTQKSLAYGKVFVDVNTTLRGTLEELKLTGRLNVLGNTDFTYVLTDSPLSVEDQLADLVEFVDFQDSTHVEKEEDSKPLNILITMSVQIDNAAQVHCILSPDRSSYVDIEGGGDLIMTYSPEKDLQMNGRYTINSGTIKYTMMVIPLKEFSIKSGSYVEFRGPLLNPTLNLAATERMRTTVTENNQPRSVNFDVGLNITQTLENLGLEFTLSAPEDMSIQNELATMSTEQRGRIAVTMLATGMYINDAGSSTSGGVNGQNALNAFLQSQISNITGKALKSVDLSLGMEQGTTSTGSTTTDYSFRFAKRFWGNRISVIVGGKVSTGEEATNTGESIIDNVSIEYRLDKSATRYVNLFYDKNYESLLDGEVTEMGGGLVLRRKTNKLGELFMFKSKKDASQ